MLLYQHVIIRNRITILRDWLGCPVYVQRLKSHDRNLPERLERLADGLERVVVLFRDFVLKRARKGLVYLLERYISSYNVIHNYILSHPN